MEKKLQTVYVPVSVEERLPSEGGRYMAYIEEINDLGISHFWWNCFFNPKDKSWSDKFQPYRALKWLEPQQAILLTQDEWDKIQEEIVNKNLAYQNLSDQLQLLADKLIKKDQEIERLKGLVEESFNKWHYPNKEQAWQMFKLQHNL